MAGRVCIPRQISSPDGLNESSNTFETCMLCIQKKQKERVAKFLAIF
jgi:hypothetical protein